jgi:RNA polymerase sigma factor for flagellar operon FliA
VAQETTPATLAPAERTALIESHVPMARMMARKIARKLPSTVPWDELESAAFLGLTEAACRYRKDREEPFMAFASKRVRGAIFDQLRRDDLLTRRGRQLARNITKTATALQGELGRQATEDEIALATGLSDEAYLDGVAALQRAHAEAFSEMYHSGVAVAEGESPHTTVERQQRHLALKAALAQLPERELIMLSLLYQEGLTLREIGDVLGISESRVCQIHKRALAGLRKRLG